VTTDVKELSLAAREDRSDRPLVSVVVPVCNGMPWIDYQLRALSNQHVQGQWELLVADNGSTDGTRACVGRWCDRDPRMRLVDASARPGAGAARNIGAREARSMWLAFCDADDVVQPGWLAAMAAALVDTDMVAGVFDFHSLAGGPPSEPIPVATRHMGFLPFALGANLGVRREAFDAAGGFCERLRAGEDIDLSWRIQLSGYRFAVAPAATVAKREHADSGPTFRTAFAYGRSDIALYQHYRVEGMKRDLVGAAKSWVWLVVTCPGLVMPSLRRQWMRTLGMRVGRLTGSFARHVFFP
jgi:GT2 family glycosyltransferase